MQIFSLPDVTPGGVATALSATSIKAVWVALNPGTNNAGNIRFGGPGISATQGALLSKGELQPYTIPRCDFNQGGYDLSKIYVFGTSTDTVSIAYGQ